MFGNFFIRRDEDDKVLTGRNDDKGNDVFSDRDDDDAVIVTGLERLVIGCNDGESFEKTDRKVQNFWS